jgi:MFS family permease
MGTGHHAARVAHDQPASAGDDAQTRTARRWEWIVSTGWERRGLVLAIILVGYLLILLDVSILMAALPRIHRDLGFSPAGLSSAQNAYTLTFGGLLLLGACAGDLLGRRRMFIAGIELFAAASAAVGLARSPAWMIAARAVQGVGAAMRRRVRPRHSRTIFDAAGAGAHSPREILADRVTPVLTGPSVFLALALLVTLIVIPAGGPKPRQSRGGRTVAGSGAPGSSRHEQTAGDHGSRPT